MMWRLSYLLSLLIYFSCFKVQEAANCGHKFSGVGYIVGGSKALPNAWPWLTVLLYKPKNKFFCGGSLISEKHVISGEKLNEFLKFVIMCCF